MKNTWATIGNYTNNTWVSFGRHFAVIGGHLGDFLVTICGSYLFLVSSIQPFFGIAMTNSVQPFRKFIISKKKTIKNWQHANLGMEEGDHCCILFVVFLVCILLKPSNERRANRADQQEEGGGGTMQGAPLPFLGGKQETRSNEVYSKSVASNENSTFPYIKIQLIV